MYRAILRNTRYAESYIASTELFKSLESIRDWFEHTKARHEENGMKFDLVLIGVEEVEVL